MENKKNYDFMSLIPFVVGSVVGIGSYFKIGKILKATGGSATIAIATWLISIFVIFCSILVIVDFMSTKDNEKINGGFVHLIEKYTNENLAKYMNTLMIYFFLPVYACIESLVAAQFLFKTVLGINSDLLLIVATFVIMGSFFIANGKSIKFGKIFQSGSVVIKLIPLTILTIFGLIFRPILDQSHFHLISGFTMHSNVGMFQGVIAAAPGTLFALDCWQWTTSLSTETEGGTKVFVKSVIVSMCVISFIYVAYTLGGLSVISGNSWAHGDHGNPLSIALAFTMLFNSKIIGQIISLFIVVAALGGLNGFSVFYSRQIKAASDRNWLPKIFSKTDDKTNLSFYASMLAFVYSSLMWSVVCILGYVNPTFWNTLPGVNFDVTASLNICSDIFSTGVFSIVYVLFAIIAIKNKKKSYLEIKSFKVPYPLFIILCCVMALGGIFGIYANFSESPIVYVISVVLIIVISLLTPTSNTNNANNIKKINEN